MLSSEDSRRLAQLERQLLRDDPEFCARMSGTHPRSGARRRRSTPLAIIAILLWIAAIVLAILNFWLPAVITAVVAGLTAAVLGYRLARRRSRFD
jgi:Flp pilus assembly protein TadB